MRPQLIQPGERVPVRLTPTQRDLILEHTFIDPELQQRLRVAETDGTSIVARLTLDDLDNLLGSVAAETNHSKDATLRKRLDTVYDRLREVDEAHTDDPSTIRRVSLFSLPKYTPKQGQYLAFIYYYTKLHGQAPSEADLQHYFEVSPPAVHRMVVALEERGFTERAPGQPRSIRLLVPRDELPDLE
jgi:repressor LexA